MVGSRAWVLAGAAFLLGGVGPEKPPAPRWEIGPFTRPVSAPVILPDAASRFDDPLRGAPVAWEALHAFNPAAVVRDGKIVVIYRAEDDSGEMKIGMHTSRLGMATSSDGVNFVRRQEPVFYPADDSEKAREWPGGVEDPRIVEAEDGSYVMTYTQWNRVTYSVGIATSADLMHWTKHGPAFLGSAGGRYDALQYKSAGIVTRRVGDRLVAAKVKGKYWMYWGEGAIRLATSGDLVHWTPVESAPGVPAEVLTKRAGHFDSGFPETGPPPVLTSHGIVMIYNGKNDPEHGDPQLGANAYAAGESLFDAHDPSRLLARTDRPVFEPEMPFEKTGQYAAGTTFAEGLVWFKGRWWLYYGCADSAVGVASTGK